MDNQTVNTTEQQMQSGQNMEQVTAGGGILRRKKPIAPFIGAAAVVLACIIGICIYNSPVNRLSRQLELGQKYLENEQYEEAILAFERAIAIDERSMGAYVGAIEAYLCTGNQEAAEEFYGRSLAVLAELDEEFVAGNMEYIVKIYLAADEVYREDPERAAQILEEGLAKIGENQEIKFCLIKDYLIIAKAGTAASAYEDALTAYDRLLELDSANAEVMDDLCNCLNKYIDTLIRDRQYGKIRELAEKYGNVAVKVDFASILAKIEELEKIEAENRAFMQKVYDLMAAEDYEGMCEVDGSEEADAFVERMESDRYIYVPDGNASLSRTGTGVYIDDGGGYYFYFGALENGERKGHGTEFQKQWIGYYIFTGEWDKDAPNGEGVEYIINSINNDGYFFDVVAKGNLIDGLWDGVVEQILTDKSRGEDYDLSFRAENGIPTEDKTEEYLAEVPNSKYPAEGLYVVSYDYHPSTSYTWEMTATDGKTQGIVGFHD